MLRGRVIQTILGVDYEYDVRGVDKYETLTLKVTAKNSKSRFYMDNNLAETSVDALNVRRVDVTSKNTKVETRVLGDKEKSPVNTDFFARFGALITYVKRNCSNKNSIDKNEIAVASGELELKLEASYLIPFEVGEGYLAEVKMAVGRIVHLRLKTDDMYIDIYEDEKPVTEQFYKIDDSVIIKTRLDSNTLGFRIKEQQLGSNNLLGNTIHEDLDAVIKAHPEKEFAYLRGMLYHIVRDDNLQEICDMIMAHDDIVYMDTETTGLNINMYSRTGRGDQCVGIILSVVAGVSYYFPMQMKYVKNLCNGDHWYFMETYMKPILELKRLAGHNVDFDWRVAYIYDINSNFVEDTQILLQVTYARQYDGFPINLKGATAVILRRDALELSDLLVDASWGDNDVVFSDLPSELVKFYACADTDNTRGILGWAKRNNLLGKYNAHKIYEIEVLFSLAVAYQRFYGHRIETTEIEELRTKTYRLIEESKQRLVKLCRHEFNPNSSQQLLKILYEELGYPTQISRKTGRPTADAGALEFLADIKDDNDESRFPFAAELLVFREQEGVRKIIDSLPEFMSDEGYIFSDVWQFGTTTGRVSVHKTNYQSYSDAVKEHIKPRPGYWAWDTDYSSIEARIMMCMAEDEEYIKDFMNPYFDYHRKNASKMFQVAYTRVSKALRKNSKAVSFGLNYGMQDPSLGVHLRGKETKENTAYAASMRKLFFGNLKKMYNWIERMRDFGERHGYTETFFGRRRYYDSSKFSASSIRRQSGNQVVQGTAADIYKIAVGNVFKRLGKEGWLGKVFLCTFVHDELYGECSDEIDKAVFLRVLREEFEVVIDGWCPLYMGFGYGQSWYEAKTTEIPINMQKSIVDRWGITGMGEEYKNNDVFFAELPNMFNEFYIEEVAKLLVMEEQQGKEIDPETLSMLQSVLKNAVGKDNIPSDVSGCIDLYCESYGVDRSKIHIVEIDETEESSGEETSMERTVTESDIVDNAQLRKDYRIDTLGMYVDEETKEVTCLMLPKNYLDIVKRYTNNDNDGYALYFKDKDAMNPQTGTKGMIYKCKVCVSSKNIGSLQNLYIQYMKSRR